MNKHSLALNMLQNKIDMLTKEKTALENALIKKNIITKLNIDTELTKVL